MTLITCEEDILNPSEEIVMRISRSIYIFLDYSDDELRLLTSSYINKHICDFIGKQPPESREHHLLNVDKTNLIDQAIQHYRLEKLDELL